MARRRSGGRNAKAGRAGGEEVLANTALPASQRLTNPLPRMEMFSADQIEALHRNSLTILRDLGIKVLLPEARDIYEKAGAIIKGDMVYIGEEIINAALEIAPKHITIHARNPHNRMEIGGRSVAFGIGAGCPNISDLQRGRRPGTMADFIETTKLQQAVPEVPKLAPSIEPQDIALNIRHLDVTATQLTLSDKVPFAYSRGRAHAEDVMALVALAHGMSDTELRNHPAVYTIINTNSPRQIDQPMAQGIIDFARWGQPCIITPFCLAGAMAPITVSGALTLSHAECLAGIALSQLARPGAPVAYGAFSSNVDMKSGAPLFGTPEHMRANFGAGQLARLAGLPWRSAAGTAANFPDAQAAAETQLALWGCLLSGANLIYHSMGWLEGGLTFSYEKFALDLDVVRSITRTFTRETEIATDDLAAIAEVTPGGHFFAAGQTMARYKTEFHEATVFGAANFGQWQEQGGLRDAEQANTAWRQMVADYTPPTLEEDRAAAIAEFTSRRKEEGGAQVLD